MSSTIFYLYFFVVIVCLPGLDLSYRHFFRRSLSAYIHIRIKTPVNMKHAVLHSYLQCSLFFLFAFAFRCLPSLLVGSRFLMSVFAFALYAEGPTELFNCILPIWGAILKRLLIDHG